MSRRLPEISIAMGGVLLLALITGCGEAPAGGSAKSGSQTSSNGDTEVEILNVSYDPTRELWKALNAKFSEEYKKEKGINVNVKQSHAGSSSQARRVIEGLEADVVSLAMPTDTESIVKAGLIKEGWQDRLPNGGLPYSSTIVFVVRKGNPKQIKDWPDLIKEGVEVITPSPKTSGNGKLSFLAAWGSVIKNGGDEKAAQEFVTKLYQHVKVLDSAARGATTTFSQKEQGDVHLTWENEAFLEIAEAKGGLEIVAPSTSIHAEPRLAVVDANVDRHNTRAVAEDYLNFLYTNEGQEIIAENYYRPAKPEILKKHSDKFLKIAQFPVTDIAISWADAERKFFGDGGVFDQIYAKKN